MRSSSTRRRRRLLVATDRLGLRPLYYSHRGDTIVFASAVRAVLNSGLVGRATDLEAVADFLAFGFVPGAKTLCEGIEVVPPGSLLTFEAGQLRLEKYWELTFEPDARQSAARPNTWSSWQDAIRSSVEISTTGEFRFGLPLSGGLDSRAIAACIPRTKYPVSVWTWGVAGSREVRTARAVTDALGLEHHSRCRTPEEFVANFQRLGRDDRWNDPRKSPDGEFLVQGHVHGPGGHMPGWYPVDQRDVSDARPRRQPTIATSPGRRSCPVARRRY